jgi:hypothetical protein
METKDVVGQFVILKEDFLEKTHKYIVGSEIIKYARPYLVIELSNKDKTKTRLFAIPTQTSVPDSMDSNFFEKLPRRIETRRGCDRGLLFGEMLPITPEQILGKKEADKLISKDEEIREVIIQNLMFRKEDSIPERGRPSFRYLQRQALHYGMAAMDDKQFQQSYRIVAQAIHNETIKEKNEKFDKIVSKAQNYLENHYIKFLRQKVYKNEKIIEDIKMPIRFTHINKLIPFLKQYNAELNAKEHPETVKTSLQESRTEPADADKKLMEKYSITRDELNKLKDQQERISKNSGNTYTLESVCRASKGIPTPIKSTTKTQEKTIIKPPKQEQKTEHKPDIKSRKKSGYNGK